MRNSRCHRTFRRIPQGEYKGEVARRHPTASRTRPAEGHGAGGGGTTHRRGSDEGERHETGRRSGDKEMKRRETRAKSLRDVRSRFLQPRDRDHGPLGAARVATGTLFQVVRDQGRGRVQWHRGAMPFPTTSRAQADDGATPRYPTRCTGHWHRPDSPLYRGCLTNGEPRRNEDGPQRISSDHPTMLPVPIGVCASEEPTRISETHVRSCERRRSRTGIEPRGRMSPPRDVAVYPAFRGIPSDLPESL
jgi:hypothetical protein